MDTIVYRHSADPYPERPDEGFFTDGTTTWKLTATEVEEVENSYEPIRASISIAVFAEDMQSEISRFLVNYIHKHQEEPDEFPLARTLDQWYDTFNEWQHLTGE
jgi:hypothetical protein